MREGFEEFLLTLNRNTWTCIDDVDQRFGFAVGSFLYDRFNGDGAFICELGSVGEQVDQYLADAHGVAAHGGHIGGDLCHQLDGLFLDQTFRGRQHAVDHFGEFDFFEVEFHFSGFDTGKIENVID